MRPMWLALIRPLLQLLRVEGQRLLLDLNSALPSRALVIANAGDYRLTDGFA